MHHGLPAFGSMRHEFTVDRGQLLVIEKGPSQEASRNLVRPGILLNTLSPMENLAARADSLLIRLAACLEFNDAFTTWLGRTNSLSRSSMNWGTLAELVESDNYNDLMVESTKGVG